MAGLKIGDVFYYFNSLDPDLLSDSKDRRNIRKYTVCGLCRHDDDIEIVANFSKAGENHYLWTSFFGRSCFAEFSDALKVLEEAGYKFAELEE